MYNKNQGIGKFKGIYTPIIIKYHRGKLNPITKTHHAKYTAKKCAYKNKIHVQYLYDN